MKKAYTLFALIGGDMTFRESDHLSEDKMREIIITEYPHLKDRLIKIRYRYITEWEQTCRLFPLEAIRAGESG